MKKDLQYSIVLMVEPEGGFTVVVPALPGCISYGKTVAQAKAQIVDAIKGYIASLKKHKEPVPVETESLMSSVRVPVMANIAYA